MIIVDLETTGLNPFECKVISIQTKKGSQVSVWKEWDSDELSIIERFLRFLRSVSGDEVILGYNNLKFDIPFIYQRLSAYDKLDRTIYNLLYNKKWLDLYQFLGDDYRSMDTWLKRIGLSKSSTGITGKDVPKLYLDRKYDVIERYVLEELEMCEKLFHGLTRKYPSFFKDRV